MGLQNEITYELSKRICDLEEKLKKQDNYELLKEIKEDIGMFFNMLYDLSLHLGMIKEPEDEEENLPPKDTNEKKRLLQ